MENQDMISEEEQGILTLTNENGEDVQFEYLDVIEYQGKEYLFLMPLDDEEDGILIMEIQPVDEETENYLAIEDEALLDTLFGLFKEKFKDYFDFED
ncbi:MAG: DUF1292 domain-containing protein [Oscillospiraceae bacterium]|nr:DUF1292 domain-containing protein [Oscillospiraceae bacterium]